MKRITKNTDCKFKLKNIAGIYADKFSLALYTTSADTFKTYTEADATDGYINITYDEISLIGKGVINYVCVNHIPDEEFPDQYNDKTLYGTTDYYLDSNITVDPSSSTIDALEKLQKALTTETTERKAQDETLQAEIDDKVDKTDLDNYYSKTEADEKYATNDALSDTADAVGDLQNSKADKTDLDNYLPLSGGTETGDVTFKQEGNDSLSMITNKKFHTELYNPTKGYFGKTLIQGPSWLMYRRDKDNNIIGRCWIDGYNISSGVRFDVAGCNDSSYNYYGSYQYMLSNKIGVYYYMNRQNETNGNKINQMIYLANDEKTSFQARSFDTNGTEKYIVAFQTRPIEGQFTIMNYENAILGKPEDIYIETNETETYVKVSPNGKDINKCGFVIDGYTQDDLLTANYGVKTIGKDIAKQSDLEALQSTVGDIATLLNKINGEEI